MGREVLGWERSEIGRGVKWVYGRKSTLSGNLIFTGIWVVFLVDFSGGRGFLFSKTSVRVGEE